MEKTKITFETDDRKITYELPWDVGMEQLLDTFYSGCIGLTFCPETILSGMRDYVAERHELIDQFN